MGSEDTAELRRQQARRLADELRRIIERLCLVEAPPDELSDAADAAAVFADRLEELLPKDSWSYEGFSEAAMAPTPHAFFDRSPIIGKANPLAAPLELEVVSDDDGGRVDGRAVFSAAYEGPPGNLHGGYVAAAFDELLGLAQTLAGRTGMTGTLTVRYRSPTPLYTELVFKGWVDRVEGRKIHTLGTCHAGDRLTAEAEGIFIAVDLERFKTLMEERDRRRADRA